MCIHTPSRVLLSQLCFYWCCWWGHCDRVSVIAVLRPFWLLLLLRYTVRDDDERVSSGHNNNSMLDAAYFRCAQQRNKGHIDHHHQRSSSCRWLNYINQNICKWLLLLLLLLHSRTAEQPQQQRGQVLINWRWRVEPIDARGIRKEGRKKKESLIFLMIETWAAAATVAHIYWVVGLIIETRLATSAAATTTWSYLRLLSGWVDVKTH